MPVITARHVNIAHVAIRPECGRTWKNVEAQMKASRNIVRPHSLQYGFIDDSVALTDVVCDLYSNGIGVTLYALDSEKEEFWVHCGALEAVGRALNIDDLTAMQPPQVATRPVVIDDVKLLLGDALVSMRAQVDKAKGGAPREWYLYLRTLQDVLELEYSAA